jgi:hypothetical protein
VAVAAATRAGEREGQDKGAKNKTRAQKTSRRGVNEALDGEYEQLQSGMYVRNYTAVRPHVKQNPAGNGKKGTAADLDELARSPSVAATSAVIA